MPIPGEKTDIDVEGPTVEATEWEALEGAQDSEAAVFDNGDIRYSEEESTEPLEEDDDNAFNESDAALPDDEEEHEIGRDLGNDEELGNEQERLDRA